MFKINRKIEYALVALKHMSQVPEKTLTSAKEICDTYKMPFDPTSRVLQIMAQHGILKAEQGAYGGYVIIKDLNKITLLEISEMLSGPIKIANCFHDNYLECELTPYCNVIGPMINLNQKISELFKNIPIRDLIESRNPSDRQIRAKYKIKQNPAALQA